MFKVLNESDNCILFHEARSQIVNFSLDVEWLSDVYINWDSQLKLKNQSESEIDDYVNSNKLNFELCKKYDQLTFMVETGLQKLSDTIDKLLSAQNTLAEVLRI